MATICSRAGSTAASANSRADPPDPPAGVDGGLDLIRAEMYACGQGHKVPETGADTFESLGEAEILPHALAASLARMVGFRNILVHDYTRLDPAIVVRVLQTDVQDLEHFRAAVLNLL